MVPLARNAVHSRGPVILLPAEVMHDTTDLSNGETQKQTQKEANV
jgi:hypothetical protein